MSIPGIVWHSIFHDSPKALAIKYAFPKHEDGVLALSNVIHLDNPSILQNFSNFLSDPNLTKVQLNTKIDQLKEESPAFKLQMNAIEASESQDYNTFLLKIQAHPEFSQLANEIKALHDNQQLGFGENV